MMSCGVLDHHVGLTLRGSSTRWCSPTIRRDKKSYAREGDARAHHRNPEQATHLRGALQSRSPMILEYTVHFGDPKALFVIERNHRTVDLT